MVSGGRKDGMGMGMGMGREPLSGGGRYTGRLIFLSLGGRVLVVQDPWRLLLVVCVAEDWRFGGLRVLRGMLAEDILTIDGVEDVVRRMW